MNFRILDIVLYSFRGARRILSLRPGQMNIITGASKMGKTALIEIIDCCFGSDECRIAEGVIRQAVAWVGVRIQPEGGQAFVARRLPDRGSRATPDVFYDVRSAMECPDASMLRRTTNPSALEQLLSKHVGIRENVHQPAECQTRRSLSANIRHALFFCFQQQSEVSSNRYLFHKQGEQFVPQAIRDALPYFLGAVDDDHVAQMTELRRLRRELKGIERKLAEHEAIRGSGTSRAEALLAEARDGGLSPMNTTASNWEECVAALRSVLTVRVEPEEELGRAGDAFSQLQSQRSQLVQELQRVKDQLEAAESLAGGRHGYSREASAQV